MSNKAEFREVAFHFSNEDYQAATKANTILINPQARRITELIY